MIEEIEQQCREKGLRITGQRRAIIRVIANLDDHPDVVQLHERVSKIDSNISLSTVYRTVRLLCEVGILDQRHFGDSRARYEKSGRRHHDHVIDVTTGKVFEFRNKEIELLQEKIARKMGYRIVDHRLELFVVPESDVVPSHDNVPENDDVPSHDDASGHDDSGESSS